MAGEDYAHALARARRSLDEAECAALRDLYAAAPLGAAARAALRMRMAAHRRVATAKLVRGVPRLPRFVTDFDVAVARPEHAEEVGFLIAASFELPASSEPAFAALVSRPGWSCHVALCDGEPVAAGLLYAAGRVGWLGFAATRPGSRGHGAHSALIATRLSAATTAGCYTLVAEAPPCSGGARSTARRNLERAGFEVAYLRSSED
jgi:GNAT superfamily N-acetyltransferase